MGGRGGGGGRGLRREVRGLASILGTRGLWLIFILKLKKWFEKSTAEIARVERKREEDEEEET